MQLSLRKGVRAQLAAGTALMAELEGTPIYYKQAPTGATLPYIIYQLAGGGDDNITPRNTLDVLMDVKALAATSTQAAQIADLIRDTLHDADLTLDGGWAAYRCQHTQAFDYVENVERAQIWHAGGTYRIRASK